MSKELMMKSFAFFHLIFDLAAPVLSSISGCGETTVMKHVFGKMKVCYIVRSPNTRCHPNVLLLEESEVQKRLSQSGLILNNIRQTLVKLWEDG